MKSDTSAAGIPDLLLERYALDEVSPAERAQIERRLGEDTNVRGRLEAIRRSDRDLRGGGFPVSLAKQVQGRAALDTRRGWRHPSTPRGATTRIRRWAVPLAVGVTAVVVVVVGSYWRGPQTDWSGERIKGLRPSLTVFRQTPGGSERLADAAIVRAGDVVRVAYQAAGQSYGVIVSIDGRGGVTVHLPPEGRDAVRLQAGDRVLLDHAYELDDAPRWECFYFVTAQRPFDVQPVVDAAKREAALHGTSPPPALPVSAGLEQSRFVLQKEQRP